MFCYKSNMLSVDGEILIASGLIFFCVWHMQDEANSYYEILFSFFYFNEMLSNSRSELTYHYFPSKTPSSTNITKDL